MRKSDSKGDVRSDKKATVVEVSPDEMEESEEEESGSEEEESGSGEEEESSGEEMVSLVLQINL